MNTIMEDALKILNNYEEYCKKERAKNVTQGIKIPEGYELDENALKKGYVKLKEKEESFPKNYEEYCNLPNDKKYQTCSYKNAGDTLRELLILRDHYNHGKKIKFEEGKMYYSVVRHTDGTISIVKGNRVSEFIFEDLYTALSFLTNVKELLNKYYTSL